MNKRAIGLVVIALLSTGCQQDRNDILMDQCVGHLKQYLKDPDSLKITEENPVTQRKQVTIISFDYNAKNGFGGYTGISTFHCEFNEIDQLIRFF